MMIAIIILSVCLIISALWGLACFFAVKAMQQDIHDKNKQIEFLKHEFRVLLKRKFL